MLESIPLSSRMSPLKCFSEREEEVFPREDVFPSSSVVLREGSIGVFFGKALEGSNSDSAKIKEREIVGMEREGF